MDSANGRLTSEEIATEILRQLAPPCTKRTPTLRSVRNRVWTFLRNHRRHGNVRPVVVKGKKAQGWQWVGPDAIPSEAEPTSSPTAPYDGQREQHAGV